MRQVVITGVSIGIGHACVKVLIAHEIRVFGSVHKQTDADGLQREFGDMFVPLLFDVTDETAVQLAAEKVDQSFYSAQEAKSGLAPEVIGKAFWRALTVTRPRVRSAIIPKRFVNSTIPQLIPMRILDKLVAQFFGIKRRKQG
jgi:NAD(P)-dependent dehydrogenase (short-subunit alcohol dehydrogenase family)